MRRVGCTVSRQICVGLILVLLEVLFPTSVDAQQPILINSFESQDDLLTATKNHTTFQRQAEHATDGKFALRIDFQPADWPNLIFLAPDAGWNWEQSAALAIDVINLTDETVPFSIRIDDDPRANGHKYCRTGSGQLRAGRGTTTFVLSLGSAEPMSFGMRGLPGYTGTMMYTSGEINTSHITAFQIFMHHPKISTPLVIDNIRLLPAPSLEGIVDQFGQFTGYL
jgi:hypothetical protein